MTPLRIIVPLDPQPQNRPRASLMVATDKLRSAMLPGWKARDLGRCIAAVRKACASSIHITEGDSPAAKWKRNGALLIRMALKRTAYVLPPPDLPLEVWLWFYWPWPKSQARKRDPRPIELRARKPDGDNVEKCVLDACTGLLWTDDAQVAVTHHAKLMASQGEQGRVVIQVAEAGFALHYLEGALAFSGAPDQERAGLQIVSAGR